MMERNGSILRRQWILAAALALALGLSVPEAGAPAARANAQAASGRLLVPGGKSLGIAIETEGLMVVGTSDLGMQASPARLAGLNSGDIITEIDDVQVRSADELTDRLKAGQSAAVRVVREGKARTVRLTPAADSRDGRPRIGAWVRSSTAGVGTLTYVDPQSGEFAALGHPITDADTGVVLPVEEGGVYNNRIARINKSEEGFPGEIVGDFLNESESIGEIAANTGRGIYGIGYSGAMEELPYPGGLPAADRDDVRPGKAQMLTTIDEGIRAYDCEIEQLDRGSRDTRSFVVRITDEELIQKTGGIVQGMSGSPIVQNGRLVGAVTHVLVNDPTRGYGIFIENMLEAAE